jgi:hypothetical protein
MDRREFLDKAKKLAICSTILPIIGNASSKKMSENERIEPKDIFLSNNHVNIRKDVFLEKEYHSSFNNVRKKLNYVQHYIGYGNFNIISFDEAINVLKYSKDETVFTKEELAFIEHIFYYEPTYHGFFGDRITNDLTYTINKKEIIKIPYTGHYMFKGKPKEAYLKMKKDIGPTIYLTSGIRSVMKQMKLFLDKLHSVDMNLSLASRSIAPPAFTYHSVGDFDVGKKGLGADNFTKRFSYTSEFSQMMTLKYIDMRYTIGNKDGVRYEPWHVKVI